MLVVEAPLAGQVGLPALETADESRALGDTLLTLMVATYLGSGPMSLEPPLGRGLAGWPLALGLLLLALLPLVTAAASAGRRQGRRA